MLQCCRDAVVMRLCTRGARVHGQYTRLTLDVPSSLIAAETGLHVGSRQNERGAGVLNAACKYEYRPYIYRSHLFSIVLY